MNPLVLTFLWFAGKASHVELISWLRTIVRISSKDASIEGLTNLICLLNSFPIPSSQQACIKRVLRFT